MTTHAFAILRAVHILAGSVWVGAALLNAAYLIPSVMASGPAGGQVMRVMVQVRRLPVFMNAVMLFTLASGAWLYVWVSGSLSVAWITSKAGMTLTFGALCALATAGMAHFITVPTVTKIGQLGSAIASAGGPPSPEQAAEMGALQRRMLRVTRIGTALVIVASIAMSLARFLWKAPTHAASRTPGRRPAIPSP